MDTNPLKKNEYIQKRAQNIGLTMIVMGGSFFLYYLGLFGNVEGPLTPGNIGESLAGMGVTKIHMLIFFLSFFIIAMTWNHIFNLVSYIIGSRLTCIKKNDEGNICGASTEKIKIKNTENTKEIVKFKCIKGHKCSDASFHPVKKGVISHTVWVTALVFCAIILYCS
ncbi:MAG: hypothetical protein K8S13_08570 [Desulfobacula sp.]|uniref:hypothetical protein n=1 Tax=Desulfobacula sp. TaxID=2593537 RepID=UPI0025B97B85|nr:hypothetical protein [Desulfobacula sp.]MCD4719900.1 hypothetical protein [Desulfobacula sp.]